MTRAPRAGAFILDPRWPELRARLEATTSRELPLASMAREVNRAARLSGESLVTTERLRTAMKRSGVRRKLPEDQAALVRVSFVCPRAHAYCGRAMAAPGYAYVIEPIGAEPGAAG